MQGWSSRFGPGESSIMQLPHGFDRSWWAYSNRVREQIFVWGDRHSMTLSWTRTNPSFLPSCHGNYGIWLCTYDDYLWLVVHDQLLSVFLWLSLAWMQARPDRPQFMVAVNKHGTHRASYSINNLFSTFSPTLFTLIAFFCFDILSHTGPHSALICLSFLTASFICEHCLCWCFFLMYYCYCYNSKPYFYNPISNC